MTKIYRGDPEYLEPTLEGQPDCETRYMTTWMECTRPAGHSRDHAAHGVDDGQIARWPQEPK